MTAFLGALISSCTLFKRPRTVTVTMTVTLTLTPTLTLPPLRLHTKLC